MKQFEETRGNCAVQYLQATSLSNHLTTGVILHRFAFLVLLRNQDQITQNLRKQDIYSLF